MSSGSQRGYRGRGGARGGYNRRRGQGGYRNNVGSQDMSEIQEDNNSASPTGRRGARSGRKPIESNDFKMFGSEL